MLNLIQALVARLDVDRLKREEGQTIVEYGLVIGGISLVLITFFIVADLGAVFSELITDINTAMTGD